MTNGVLRSNLTLSRQKKIPIMKSPVIKQKCLKTQSDNLSGSPSLTLDIYRQNAYSRAGHTIYSQWREICPDSVSSSQPKEEGSNTSA